MTLRLTLFLFFLPGIQMHYLPTWAAITPPRGKRNCLDLIASADGCTGKQTSRDFTCTFLKGLPVFWSQVPAYRPTYAKYLVKGVHEATPSQPHTMFQNGRYNFNNTHLA